VKKARVAGSRWLKAAGILFRGVSAWLYGVCHKA